MNDVAELARAAGIGLLVGAFVYLVFWGLEAISQPQRFPNTRAHIERPRAAKIDLVRGHDGGSVAADLHHHERQWGAAIEAGAAASPACMGGVMCLATVEAGTAQERDHGGSGSGMTDRLDTIRKRLASGNPFTPHAGDLAWAVGEIERLTAQLRLVDGARNEMRRELDDVARSEIARLDALSRATADDPEDVVPCVPCGRVECECGDARDEENCA